MNIKKEKIISDIFSLGIMQGFNYLLPLISFPYIVRAVGIDKFGLLSFATATIGYFLIIIDYGFNYTATRNVSIVKSNQIELNKIFSAVTSVKIALMVLCLAALISLSYFVDRIRQDSLVYFLSFGMVIGSITFPIWLLQGLGEIKFIAILNVASKVLFTLIIFIFVNDQKDFFVIPLATLLSCFLTSIVSIFFLRSKYKIQFIYQPISILKSYISSGWHVFLTNISTSLYTTTTIFMIGLFTSNSVVGFYAVADKIIGVVKNFYQIIPYVLYPIVTNKINQNVKLARLLINQIQVFVGLVMFIISLVIYCFSSYIVSLLIGEDYLEAVNILKLLAFVPLIVAFSNIYAVLGLYSMNEHKTVNKFVMAIAAIHMILVIPVIVIYKAEGAAFLTLVTEALITLFSIYFFRKLTA